MTVKLVLRPSPEREFSELDWLKSFHTFSIKSDAEEHSRFGALRILNEDRVEAHTGFGPHAHREFEIFTYVISGELEHGDSMQNEEILKRGDIQMTSAGTGIRHSEKAHGDKQVHFLQMWAYPLKGGLTPRYFTRHFTDESKKDKWVQVVVPVGSKGVVEEFNASGPTPIHSALTLFVTLLSPSRSLPHTLTPIPNATEQKVYIHLPQTSGYNPSPSSGAHIKVSASNGNSVELREGDGLYITVTGGKSHTLDVQNIGDVVAEPLLFELE